MAGFYTPLMLTAAAGILQNSGIGIGASFSAALSRYRSGAVGEFRQVVRFAEGKTDYPPDPDPYGGGSPPYNPNLTPATTLQLQTFTASSFPAITDTRPSGSTFGNSTSRFTDQIISHGNNILGDGDLSKFAIHMFSAQAFTQSAEDYIDNAKVANALMGSTFTNTDNLMTGGITGVNLAVAEFGSDLQNTGDLISFDNLPLYGSPYLLIKKLLDRGLLKYIEDELAVYKISVDGLTIKMSADSTVELPLIIQKKCYDAFESIAGTKLNVILKSLKVNTPNIKKLSDLLDTKKIFPTSFRTLTSPIGKIFERIYTNENGFINSKFVNFGKKYHSVIPKDVADANAAMSRSLQQIRNIQNLTAQTLGATIAELQTTVGLPSIASLSTPVPQSVVNYFTQEYGQGSGLDGKYYLSDAIGTPAGIVHIDELDKIVGVINELNSYEALDYLWNLNGTGVFTVMKNFLSNEYGTPYPGGDDGMGGTTSPVFATIPGGLPGAGSYSSYSAGLDVLIGLAAGHISTLANTYPDLVARSNAATTAMVTQVELELATLEKAGIVFEDTPTSESSLLSLASNLQSYALEDKFRGPGELLEKMADSSQSGQAIVAAMREARNIRKLQSIGVGVDCYIDVPEDTQKADISDGQYTLTQAITGIIT